MLSEINKRIDMRMTIIGCGNMGAAFAKRLSMNHKIGLFDCDSQKAEKLAHELKGHFFSDVKKAVEWSEVIVLAVKPQNLKEAALQFNACMKNEQILFSLLAGVTLDTLIHYFPHCQIVRLMPNLAIGHGEGVIGLATAEELDENKKRLFMQLFAPLGKIFWLSEDKFNAFISLGGSGPAFMFVLIEAMIEAGITMGFTVNESQSIVSQMIKGSLTMLDETEKHPGKLKWEVASPGGTTISGLNVMEEEAVRSSIIKTFVAAYTKAMEMDSKLKK